MNNTNVTRASKAGTSKLVRAKFGPGMLLQHEDLEQLNSYTRDLSRIMFRSLFGCGVVCGLVVTPEEKCGKVFLTVGSGVAIACSGDPVWVPKDESFPMDENCDPELGNRLWVVLCGTVKCCAPRTAVCGPDDDEAKAECTRERDGYEIRVVSARPDCVCGCPEEDEAYDDPWNKDCWCVNPELKCYEYHYAGKCGCDCDECSDCDCKCVLLARLDRVGDTEEWKASHRYRRFVRPVLMRDPQVEEERPAATILNQQSQMQRRVETAAMVEAEKTIREAAEKAAHDAARKAAKEIAVKIGNEAAQLIMKKVAPREVAVEASEKLVRETAKPLTRRKTGGLPVSGQKEAEAADQATGARPTKKAEKPTEPIVIEEPHDPETK